MVNLHILSSIVCFKEATLLSTELFICLKRRGKAALSDMNGEILRASQHTCAGPVSLSISNCRSRRSSYLAGLAFGKSLLFLAQLEQISATSPFNTPGWSKTYSGGQKKKKKSKQFFLSVPKMEFSVHSVLEDKQFSHLEKVQVCWEGCIWILRIAWLPCPDPINRFRPVVSLHWPPRESQKGSHSHHCLVLVISHEEKPCTSLSGGHRDPFLQEGK